MSSLELVCLVTICLVIVFGIVSIALLESTVHDMNVIETRQDRLESRIYILDKLLHAYMMDSKGHEQQGKD